MDNNCVHCSNPNPEYWFYCKKCSKKSSYSKFTTNLYMISEAGKRTDIEFSHVSMEDSIKEIKKERIEGNQKFWKDKLKEHKNA